jgi:hypothetical protein
MNVVDPANVVHPARVSRRTALTGLGALAAAACSKLAFVAANVPAAFGAYKRRGNVAYGTDPSQRLDVYTPETPSAAPRPVVVFWYGGRWESGDKDDYRFVGAAAARLASAPSAPSNGVGQAQLHRTDIRPCQRGSRGILRQAPRPQPAAVILKVACALPWSKRRSRRFRPSGPVTKSREMNS